MLRNDKNENIFLCVSAEKQFGESLLFKPRGNVVWAMARTHEHVVECNESATRR